MFMDAPELVMIGYDNSSPAMLRIYRVCSFEKGAVIPRVELIKASSDAQAVEMARNLNSSPQCEIWEGHRLVGEFSPGLLQVELPGMR